MQLQGYVAQLQAQLAAQAALGDEHTRRTAEMLAMAAGPAIQLALLEAISAAAEEITAALLDVPGAPAIGVRLEGGELRVDVRVGTDEEPPQSADDGELTARISLRLSEALKADVEAAARQANVSVNTWLNRAAANAAANAAAGRNRAGGAPASSGAHALPGHRVTGWLNG